MTTQRLRLGEILVSEGLITEEKLTQAIEAQKKGGGKESIGAILIRLGFISDKNLALTLSKQLGILYVSKEDELSAPPTDKNLLRLVPEEFARKYCVLPLKQEGDKIMVALADPLDVVVLDNLRKMTGCDVRRVVASRGDVEAGITAFYGEGGMLRTAVEASYAGKETSDVAGELEDRLTLDDLVMSAEKAPVVKFTDLLVRQAILQRASDIHLEPFADRICMRFRIDGVLQEIPPPDVSMSRPIISRFKILSKMDIAEKRLPQDGSFSATIENRPIDFRVSTVPTVHGEKMVIRVLDRSSVTLSLDSMSFSPEELKIFRTNIHKPHGLVLLTGPTGSGKTTTLYASLHELKGPDKNIMTVEDPVEYQIPGINQVQVKASIGLTFAAGLRAFLRQDPDVMLVGEIRDLETAQICVRASLTGRLVFSTLHTNDAPSAVTRLVDIGIEPYFVSSSLLMVVGQRLIRKLCPKCKEPYKPQSSQLPKDFKLRPEVLYKPKGCAECSKTGYRGRMAVYEIMTISPEIQDLITRRAPLTDIRTAVLKNGMITLEENGYRKAAAGETSLQEVFRVLMAEA
jgi:type IV pilus assembly protein PilB